MAELNPEVTRRGWHTAELRGPAADVEDLAAAHAALSAKAGFTELPHGEADQVARAFLADFAQAAETDMVRFARLWVARVA